ncbi:MAG: RNA polymerase sigma factor [Acidobacteria bacterium]|nr:MAG: RNA polymerase sigma factor [Acidobacteriota bacterium]
MRATNTMPITDVELARASAAGDEWAFERIYRSHVRKVYSICLRLLGDPADAEEVTQDVFVRLFQKIGTFRGDAALSTWLHRLAVNTALMALRHRRRRLTYELSDDMRPSLENSPSGSRRDGLLLDRIALERAIAQLPPGYRTVFVLHDIEGYQHEEIAEMLGIAVGTAKSQLHKARLKMRQLLRGARARSRE